MTQHSRTIIIRALCLTITLLFFHVAAGFSEEKSSAKEKEAAAAKTSPSTVLAKVNGVAITQGERDQAINELMAQGQVSPPNSPEMKQKMEKAALDQLIDIELLYQNGKKLQINDLDTQVNDKVAQAKAQFPSPADFEKALKSANISEAKLKDITRKNLIINNLLTKEVYGKITVSEADAKKFYDENPDKFKVPESVRASHVLIGADAKATAEEKKKAKEKAEAVRKRIAGGEDFATVAKKESTCPSSAKGGDLGFFGKGQMAPEFEKAAFGLKPGALSDVVETQFGYHVIKLTDRKPAETVKFADAKGKIEAYLKNQQAQKPLAEYIEKVRKAAKVESM
jgi:peptidyl-prolyl cis-trans isomerase C